MSGTCVEREVRTAPFDPVRAQHPVRRVEVQRTLVEAVALADREHVERVGVVRHEHDPRADRLAVDGDADRLAVGRDDRERAQTRERVAPPPVVLAPVDELRVDAERDVVQEQPVVRAADVDAALDAVDERLERADRVVAVEPEVAREVVARPEGDADERQVSLDRDLGHRRQRAVAARHPERVGIGVTGELPEVVAVAEHMHVDPRARGRLDQLVVPAVTRARVDDQEGPHARNLLDT